MKLFCWAHRKLLHKSSMEKTQLHADTKGSKCDNFSNLDTASAQKIKKEGSATVAMRLAKDGLRPADESDGETSQVMQINVGIYTHDLDLLRIGTLGNTGASIMPDLVALEGDEPSNMDMQEAHNVTPDPEAMGPIDLVKLQQELQKILDVKMGGSADASVDIEGGYSNNAVGNGLDKMGSETWKDKRNVAAAAAWDGRNLHVLTEALRDHIGLGDEGEREQEDDAVIKRMKDGREMEVLTEALRHIGWDPEGLAGGDEDDDGLGEGDGKGMVNHDKKKGQAGNKQWEKEKDKEKKGQEEETQPNMMMMMGAAAGGGGGKDVQGGTERAVFPLHNFLEVPIDDMPPPPPQAILKLKQQKKQALYRSMAEFLTCASLRKKILQYKEAKRIRVSPYIWEKLMQHHHPHYSSSSKAPHHHPQYPPSHHHHHTKVDKFLQALRKIIVAPHNNKRNEHGDTLDGDEKGDQLKQLSFRGRSSDRYTIKSIDISNAKLDQADSIARDDEVHLLKTKNEYWVKTDDEYFVIEL